MLSKIRKDLVKAIKAKDNVKRDAIRVIVNAINNCKKQYKFEDVDITDEVITQLVMKEIRQVGVTLEYALKDRRVDLLEELGTRLNILDDYTPTQMVDEDVRGIILVIAQNEKITSITNRDRGTIIKKAINLTQGRTDGPRINRIITQLIKEHAERDKKLVDE